jgi:hypothetical protein
MSDHRPLDDDEAARVFRRASELDVELAGGSSGWDVARLEDVGREVGISPEAVRRAAAEVRLAEAEVALGEPLVRTVRIVPADPAAAQERLATWLREQLFEPVRNRPGYLLVERREDEEARRRRRRDEGGRYRLGAAGRVAVAVAEVPGGGSAVRVDAGLAVTWWRRSLPTALWITAVVALALFVAGAPGWSYVLAVSVGNYAGWWRGRGAVERDAAQVRLAVDGAIDRLER